MADLMTVPNLMALAALLLIGYMALLAAFIKRLSVPVPDNNPMEHPHVAWTASYEGKGTVTLYFGSDTDARDAYLWLLATRPRMTGRAPTGHNPRPVDRFPQVPLPGEVVLRPPREIIMHVGERRTNAYGDAQKIALLRAMQEITSHLNLPTNSTCQDVVDNVKKLSREHKRASA